MKKIFSILIIAVLACLSCAVLVGCSEPTDYAAQLTLDMSSTTAKQEVTVKTYIDGDTTHFNVPKSVVGNGILKARYLAVDTPESTNIIDDYGKTASKFTKNKLSTAKSIMLEADSDVWKPDSTGSRYMVWVWYKAEENGPYRNLNLELLQSGLAKPSNIMGNRYSDICVKALNDAKEHKLLMWSGKEDPDVYRGPTVQLTLKDLRTNLEEYLGVRVGFTGVVARTFDQTAYIEAYDEATGKYFGMASYYGFVKNPAMLEILSVGNEVYVAGNVEYWEAGGTYQVSNLRYSSYPVEGDVDSVKLISTGKHAAYSPVSASDFADGTASILCKDGVTRTFGFAELAMNTTVSMTGLSIAGADKRPIYTTDNGGDNDGAMTITCTSGGKTITVRTNVLYDENNNLITADYFYNKTIDIKGMVEYFDGEYQIKVVTLADITVH